MRATGRISPMFTMGNDGYELPARKYRCVPHGLGGTPSPTRRRLCRTTLEAPSDARSFAFPRRDEQCIDFYLDRDRICPGVGDATHLVHAKHSQAAPVSDGLPAWFADSCRRR